MPGAGVFTRLGAAAARAAEQATFEGIPMLVTRFNDGTYGVVPDDPFYRVNLDCVLRVSAMHNGKERQ